MSEDPDRTAALDSAKRGQSRRLSSNAVVNVAGSIAYYVAVVLVTPVAIHFLGDDAWGIWQLVGATTSYALLLNLGLNSAIAYEISRSIASDDLGSVGRAINDARVYFWAAAALMILLLAVGGSRLVGVLVGPQQADLALGALAISVAITALTFPPRVFPSVLVGLQRFDLLAGFRVVAGFLLLISVIAGFYAGMGLLGFAAFMTLIPVTPALLSWLTSRRLLPPECFRWQRIDLPNLRRMVGYSINTVIYIAGTVILYQTSKFIASWRCGGPAAAGYMGLAIFLTQTLSVVFISLCAVIQPRASALNASGKQRELEVLVRRALSASGAIGVPLVAFLACEAPAIFDAWVGRTVSPEIVTLVARTVRFMLIGQGVYVVYLPCFYALLGIDEHRPFGIGMILTGLLAALLGVGATHFQPTIDVLGGVFGVSLAALVLLVTLPIALRRFSLSAGGVMRDSIAIPALVALPGVVASFWRPRLEEPLLDLVVAGAIFGACTLPGLYLIRGRLRVV